MSTSEFRHIEMLMEIVGPAVTTRSDTAPMFDLHKIQNLCRNVKCQLIDTVTNTIITIQFQKLTYGRKKNHIQITCKNFHKNNSITDLRHPKYDIKEIKIVLSMIQHFCITLLNYHIYSEPTLYKLKLQKEYVNQDHTINIEQLMYQNKTIKFQIHNISGSFESLNILNSLKDGTFISNFQNICNIRFNNSTFHVSNTINSFKIKNNTNPFKIIPTDIMTIIIYYLSFKNIINLTICDIFIHDFITQNNQCIKNIIKSMKQVETKITKYRYYDEIIWDPLCYNQLCIFYNTTIFKFISRLLHYNSIYTYTLHTNNDKQLKTLQSNYFNNDTGQLRYSLKLFTIFKGFANNNMQYITNYSAKRFHYRELTQIENSILKNPCIEHNGTISTKILNNNNKHVENTRNKIQQKYTQDVSSINNPNTFIKRLNERFFYKKWNDIVFTLPKYGKFCLAGGSVLYCILKHVIPTETDSKLHGLKDLDIFALGMNEEQFIHNITTIIKTFKQRGYLVICNKSSGEAIYKPNITNVYVKINQYKTKVRKHHPNENTFDNNINIIKNEEYMNWIHLQFVYCGSFCKLFQILNIYFDIDACQVAFNGNEVLCSYAFIQSVSTMTIMSNSLINNPLAFDRFIHRIRKYYARGFDILVPLEYVNYLFHIFYT